TLIPILHQKAKRGTPHQAKQAVHCIHAIFNNKEVQLAQIFEPLSRSLNADVPEQLITPLVSLGHISMLAPDQFASPMKSIVANFIVKDLLMNDRSVGNKNGKLWSADEEVSPEVLAKVQAIKLLVRWLLGMKNNQSKSANSTLRLLSAMLVSEGDLTEQKKISKSDMSRLRLAAGSAIMKLAQEPCYHEIITPEQFQLCGLVINDECYQVRQIFAQKLHLALVKLLLPLEYLAVFALCAKDPVKERRAHARQCLLKNISVRREYIKQNPLAQEKLVSLLPEYVVPFMIHLLVHDPDFTKPHEYEQLKDIKECLWFMLEVLMTKNENNSHAFLRKMVENIKQTKDAQCPEDAKANEKLYIVCDVALFVIANKSTACHLDCQKEPVLPAKFFLIQDKEFKNEKEYLAGDMRQMLLTGKPKPAPVLATVNKTLTVPGRRVIQKTTITPDTSTNSSPLVATNNNSTTDTSESRAQENNENPVMKTEEIKKADLTQKLTPEAGIEASPVRRRGRPTKAAAAAAAAALKEAGALPAGGGVGRGRKRAADAPTDSINVKMSKQQQQQSDEGMKRQIDLQR
ncbi:sister chromatid cohesion protein PDS5 homolog A-like, partial [Cyprinodon tularosa]|uniref:sister chromatid cohesion protein PDS5 homolog A-like n=1 Tax=Cyprinodon tularosa TaxID=77115 RepID=UPI0018E253B7